MTLNKRLNKRPNAVIVSPHMAKGWQRGGMEWQVNISMSSSRIIMKQHAFCSLDTLLQPSHCCHLAKMNTAQARPLALLVFLATNPKDEERRVNISVNSQWITTIFALLDILPSCLQLFHYCHPAESRGSEVTATCLLSTCLLS